MVIQKTSVMWTGKRSVVYVREISDKGIDFVMREVKLGLPLGESYVVEDGLKEGEEIAINGTFSIDAAAQLAGKPSMMNNLEVEETNVHKHKIAENPVTKTNLSKAAKTALQPLYTAYFGLKNALVKDDLKTAKSSSERLKTALKNIDMSLFGKESHTLYMTYYSNLNNELEHFSHLTKIEKARQKFQAISETMIAMSKSFEPLDNIIYVQFCPMADDNKGANWLSQEKDIKNPYFGNSMLTCGEVSLEIKSD